MADSHLIEIEYLRQCIRHDAAAGSLTWLERPLAHFPSARICNAWNSRCAGKPAVNNKARHGYLTGKIGDHNLYAHRVLWALEFGQWPEQQIDHINGDKTDNRLVNLREVSHAENQRNMRKDVRNTSGHTGVTRAYNRWAAKISGEVIGTFETKADAIEARERAASERGFHENHGKR